MLDKTADIAKNMLDHKEAKYNAHWEEDDLLKDWTKEAEKEMYQGWHI
ncbi:hypothetical protein [Pectinatus haikarae]|uniref:Uncharacterized protein n=1 Tax=Pectinatus haikarae TaxID=349096 RepID=A0ABT9Y8E9_9FIRM|nr:hypothetical protein [Pectinatus haikarae]MDQ0204115.1 hypothetical protein [Pectinatus haikarae]